MRGIINLISWKGKQAQRGQIHDLVEDHMEAGFEPGQSGSKA